MNGFTFKTIKHWHTGGSAMQKMYLHIRGPIRRPIWNRMRRRLVKTSSAGVITMLLAGGTVYVLSAVEPSLSGVWVRQDGLEVRLFHIGNRVTGIFEKSGSTNFVANFTSPSRMEGYMYVVWRDQDMRESCGDDAWKTSFKANVMRGDDVIEYEWRQENGDPKTCDITSYDFKKERLQRKTS